MLNISTTKRGIFVFIYCQLLCFLVCGQNTPNLTTLTPEANALGFFGKVPVGPFTGTANVSVPIYEVSGSQIKVPISLSYISSGVKIKDIAPWTGINWALNAGGLITYVIKDWKDGMQIPYDPELLENRTEDEQMEIYSIWASSFAHPVDLERDYYTYSFLGNTGKIMLDNDTAYTLPVKPLKLINFNNTDLNKEIVDENGTKYFFEKKGKSYAWTYSNFRDSARATIYYYLTKIISSDLSDSIVFTYITDHIEYSTPTSTLSITFPEDPISTPEEASFYYTEDLTSPSDIFCFVTEDIVINDEIKSNKVRLKFNAVSRGDTSISALKKLGSISIFGENDTQELKKYSFNYLNINNRIFLDSITEVGRSGVVQPYYKFKYNSPEFLPSRTGFGNQFDSWGYYNYNPSGQLLDKQGFDIPQIRHLASADRTPNQERSLLGSIDRIYYPTGGYTKFVYELNQAFSGHDNHPYNIGGLRIKSIEDYNSMDILPFNVRKYEYVGKPQVYYYPAYTTHFQSNRAKYPLEGSLIYIQGMAIFTLSEVQVNDIVTIQGSHVGYPIVKEMNGLNGENGYTVYHYSGQKIDSGSSTLKVGVPPDLFSHRIGNLTKKIEYNSLGRKIKEDSFEYISFNTSRLKHKTSAIAQILKSSEVYETQAELQWEVETDYWASKYETYTEWFYKIADTVRIYDLTDSTKYEEAVTEYKYDNEKHQQVSQVITKRSDKSEISLVYKYPEDYLVPGAGVNNSAGINDLINRHVIAAPVEIIKRQKKPGDSEVVIQASLNMYENIKLRKQYVLEIDRPIGDFVPSSINNLGEFIKDSRFKENATYYYYGNVNPLEVLKRDGTKTSYIWDDKGSVVAECVNASYDQIAYSYGYKIFSGWTAVESGHNCDGFTGILSKNVTLGDYMVGVWAAGNVKVNGQLYSAPVYQNYLGASYYEVKLNGVSSISVEGTCITLSRLYPVTAQITTYYHRTLVGLISKNDHNGNLIYYDYDSFGRLISIKDQYYNIIKRFCYNYRGQSGDCSLIGNDSTGTTFTRNNCTNDSTGGLYVYSVPANKYFANSKEEANQLALKDLTEKGPVMANKFGSCLAGNTTIFCIHYENGSYDLDEVIHFKFINPVTHQEYVFETVPGQSLGSFANNQCYLPSGTYTVQITRTDQGYHEYEIGNTYMGGYGDMILYDVIVNDLVSCIE
jgi:YD repeat-containing protein